jgi:hypothetical protein
MKGKVKGKVFPVLSWAPRREDVLGSGGIAPRILDLGTRWRWVASLTSRPLYPQGKSPWYPLDKRLGGPQSRSGCDGEEKNSQPPPGIEPYNPDRPTRSPALYRLSYHRELNKRSPRFSVPVPSLSVSETEDRFSRNLERALYYWRISKRRNS